MTYKKYKYRRKFVYKGVPCDIRADSIDDLYDKITEKKEKINSARYVDNNLTVRKWRDIWLEAYKRESVSDQTYKTYKGILSCIDLEIPLDQVRATDLQILLNNNSTKSKSYIRKLSFLLKDMFETAFIEERIEKNPAAKLKVPDCKEGTRRSITDFERFHIEKVADEEEGGLFLDLMLHCGLRPGEASIVQGKDIDKDKRLLHVRGTKTAAADRYVPIPEKLFEKLAKLEYEQYAVTDTNGNPTNYTTRRSLWRRLKKKMQINAGCEMGRPNTNSPWDVPVGDLPIPDDLVPYCLRHTYCTDLEEAGIPINVARDLMGHSSILITSKIYTHRNEKVILDAAKKINEFKK